MKIIDTHELAYAMASERYTLQQIVEEVVLPHDDAIFISPGGSDINPALYGQENIYSNVFMPEVDQAEFNLIKALMEYGKPLLGICRGHQLVTAVTGGTLYQDIQIESGHPHLHADVYVLPDSTLASILGTSGLTTANSMHHQAVNELPPSWSVAAVSLGMIEAIESEDHPNVVSVQWHPESPRLQHQLDKILEYLSGVQHDTYRATP